MSFFLTFVASDPHHKPLSKNHLREAEKIMRFYDMKAERAPAWSADKKAADLIIDRHPGGVLMMHLRDMLQGDAIDLFCTAAENRVKKLLLADMDSTIVSGETLDELAEFAGIKDEIAQITALAMEGKLDFKDALRRRVALLKGLDQSALEKTLAHTRLNPGAAELVSGMKAAGAICVLVSGGFTFFTESIAARAGFDHHHGNILEIENGKLTGGVREPILDKFAKVEFLKHYTNTLGLTAADCLTIGDGANDIPMLKTAGLGIGYHPKQAVAEEVENLILYGDLSAALYAQGL